MWKCDGCHCDSASQSDTESISDMLRSLKRDLSKEIQDVRTSINTNIQDVKSQLDQVKTSITTMQDTLGTLTVENEKRKADFARLSTENISLKSDLAVLESRVHDLEQYSRRDNIEIVGVPYTNNESLFTILGLVARVLNIPFSRVDFSTVHRLPVTQSRPNPPIIARFVVRDCKVAWIKAYRENRKELTGAALSDSFPSYPVYVNDHLTTLNKKILGKARQLVREKKIAYTWTRDCRVLAKKTVDPSCPATVLRTMEDLDKLVD